MASHRRGEGQSSGEELGRARGAWGLREGSEGGPHPGLGRSPEGAKFLRGREAQCLAVSKATGSQDSWECDQGGGGTSESCAASVIQYPQGHPDQTPQKHACPVGQCRLTCVPLSCPGTVIKKKLSEAAEGRLTAGGWGRAGIPFLTARASPGLPALAARRLAAASWQSGSGKKRMMVPIWRAFSCLLFYSAWALRSGDGAAHNQTMWMWSTFS